MNWQNLPNHDERAQRLKYCIVPKLDSFLFADYQAMEFRIFGFYVAHQPTIKDFTIVKEFLAGKDPYQETARMIFGREPTKAERDLYKRGALSILYNGTEHTIYEQGLADSLDEAKDIVTAIHQARPQILKLKKTTERVMKDRGYVKTLWGRQSPGKTHTVAKPGKPSRPIPVWRRPMVNYLIQGSASDIMKDALLNIDEFLMRGMYSSHLVLTIHDEVGLDCLDSEIPSIVEALPKLMGNATVEKYLPLGLDIAIARESWAAEEDYSGGISSKEILEPGSPDGPLPWEEE
jgi:DNA polymerase-1